MALGSVSSSSYEEQYRNQLRSGSGGAKFVILHPKLLGPVRCQNCGDVEDLQPPLLTGDDVHAVSLPLPQALNPLTGNNVHAVPLPLPQALNLLPVEQRSCFICLRDPSCSRCVQEMSERTEHAAPASRGGDTPFHHAARCGNLRTIYHLIVLLWDGGVQHGGKAVDTVTMRNENGETALHTAVSVGSIEIVELLMWVHPQLGNIVSTTNISPTYLAASLGYRGVAEALYQASRIPTPIDMSYSGPNKQNALHAAALLKFSDVTQLILSWKNDLAKEKDEKGRTPLHIAAPLPQLRCRKFMCFFHSCWKEAGSVSRLLDEADSSMVYQTDNEGLCPIHVAAMANRWSSIQIMIKTCPGCMDLRDNDGRTFLHIAVQNNAVGIVRRACGRPEFAPILNIQDKNGNTALHLAADIQNLRVLCILLKNPAVLLNLRNLEGDTPLNVAKRSMHAGFVFAGNPDVLIYYTLQSVGAQHFLCRGPASVIAEREERTPAEDLDKEESAKLADSTRTLGIGSVLIASVTFAATIARVPGGSGAGSGSKESRSWQFDVFMVANALAFICAASATVGLMYSGMAMITLPFRRRQFNISVMFAFNSVTCLTAAFAVGVYMVLAPVARAAAITICAFCPLVVICSNSQILLHLGCVSGALRARLGFLPWLGTIVECISSLLLLYFWPLAVIFAWAAYSSSMAD